VTRDALTILVISLRGAEDRRRLMRAQLEVPAMPRHYIVDGVNGRDLPDVDLARLYDRAAALRDSGRELTRSEVGCALSHLDAYRQIDTQALPVALVLEDDALLGHQLLKVVDRLLPMIDPSKPEIVLLSHIGRSYGWGTERVDKTHRLVRPYIAHGAHGYLITRAAACAMLAALQPVRVAADDWGYFVRARVVSVRALIPYAIGTAPLAADSQIGDERYALQARTGWRRLVRKYLWQKGIFQLLVKPVLRIKKHESSW
jgi:glycosyl transferase, family 25